MRRIVWYSPTQTHKIRTGSSLWETGSDFVLSLDMIISETALSAKPSLRINEEKESEGWTL